MSREVNFRVFPRAGQGEREERGSVALLLTKIPYFLSGGHIPPLTLVNEVLRSGRVNAGMSGAIEWPSFEISVSEFEDVVEELTTGVAGKSFQFHEIPTWIESQDEWDAWLSFRLENIPFEENLRLLRKISERQKKVVAADTLKDEDERQKCLVELQLACLEWTDFLNASREARG